MTGKQLLHLLHSLYFDCNLLVHLSLKRYQYLKADHAVRTNIVHYEEIVFSNSVFEISPYALKQKWPKSTKI